MNYSIEHVNSLRQKAIQWKLSAPAGFEECALIDIQKMYNGIGPDRWDSGFRDRLTSVLTWCEPAVLVHDVDFSIKVRSFEVANDALEANAMKCAWFTTPWYRPMLWLARRGESRVMRELCDLGGKTAWDKAED